MITLLLGILIGSAIASYALLHLAVDWLEDVDERWRTEKAPEVV